MSGWTSGTLAKCPTRGTVIRSETMNADTGHERAERSADRFVTFLSETTVFDGEPVSRSAQVWRQIR